MEKPLETASVNLQVSGVESQGITRAGQTVIARLMETQIWYCQTALFREGSAKEQWPLLALLSWRKLPL